jgi:uncharacterized protein YbaR (Trm112 family)
MGGKRRLTNCDDLIAPDLLALLACPATGQALHMEGRELVSADSRFRYQVLNGIPCLIRPSMEASHTGWDVLARENLSWISGEKVLTDEHLVGFMHGMIVATCGNLFRGAELSESYRFPIFP